MNHYEKENAKEWQLDVKRNPKPSTDKSDSDSGNDNDNAAGTSPQLLIAIFVALPEIQIILRLILFRSWALQHKSLPKSGLAGCRSVEQQVRPDLCSLIERQNTRWKSSPVFQRARSPCYSKIRNGRYQSGYKKASTWATAVNNYITAIVGQPTRRRWCPQYKLSSKARSLGSSKTLLPDYFL